MTTTTTSSDHSVILATATGVHAGDGSTLLEVVHVSAVVADGADIWVLADSRDLYRVSPRGPTLVGSVQDGHAACVGVHDGTVWVGGDDARLWRLGDGLEAVSSFLDAPTRDRWHTPWGGPPAVMSIESGGDDLFIGVHVGGVMRSSDEGESWVPTIDIADDVHELAVGDDGRVWAATGARGLAESRDHGATWRFHVDGLHATYLTTVAAIADGVLVGASSGHGGRDGTIYRFDGDRFERAGPGLPTDLDGAVAPRRLVADDDHVAVVLPDGRVYTSHDGGRSWTRAGAGLSDVTEVAVRPSGR